MKYLWYVLRHWAKTFWEYFPNPLSVSKGKRSGEKEAKDSSENWKNQDCDLKYFDRVVKTSFYMSRGGPPPFSLENRKRFKWRSFIAKNNQQSCQNCPLRVQSNLSVKAIFWGKRLCCLIFQIFRYVVFHFSNIFCSLSKNFWGYFSKLHCVCPN